MFKVIEGDKTDTVQVVVENKHVTVPTGSSVAAAIISAGFDHTRISAINGEHRSPYCLMGVCYECLAEIDGVPNQQSCQTVVSEGMVIKIQNGLRGLK